MKKIFICIICLFSSFNIFADNSLIDWLLVPVGTSKEYAFHQYGDHAKLIKENVIRINMDLDFGENLISMSYIDLNYTSTNFMECQTMLIDLSKTEDPNSAAAEVISNFSNELMLSSINEIKDCVSLNYFWLLDKSYIASFMYYPKKSLITFAIGKEY